MTDILKPFMLTGKVAMVTGASSGFGRHFADVVAAAGAKVILTARRVDKLEEACEEINATGAQACAVEMDVTKSDSVKKAFEEAEKAFGTIDILINNAGVTIPKLLLDMTDEDWDTVVDTNLRGVFLVQREAATRMKESGCGGSIVNIASITAERVQKALASYAASKAAVVHFTKVTALELAQYDIRVNALCPGYFATPLNRGWLASDDGQALIKRIPQRRAGELEQLNGPLLLLASDAGSLMTGASVTVDGGHVCSDL